MKNLLLKKITSVFIVVWPTLLGTVAGAANFYVDPAAPVGGDGSEDAPWQSLQNVLDNGLVKTQEWAGLPPDESTALVPKNQGGVVAAGDTIWLASGDYGALEMVGFYNESDITVAAWQDAKPRFTSILVRGSAHWVLRGLHVSPAFGSPYEPTTMIDLDNHNWQGPVHHITVDQCTLRSVEDISNWTIDDWNALPANGMQVDGTQHTISNNYMYNVNFGISVSASYSLVKNNVIENFAGDGLRGLGDYSTFAYNTIKNCYDVNDNHDDGFQSWSVGEEGVGTGEVTGITLRGNLIINYEDPNQPFRGPLQGIGCFDGTFVDWVVENNVIFTDHWHGISLYGARDCQVVNNTVLDPNSEDPGPPWISIHDHKNETPPVNCTVQNNLTTALANSDGVNEVANMIIDDLSDFFVDVSARNFNLLENAPAVDAGVADGAPSVDMNRIPRPQGGAVDVGAFEWHSEDITAVEDTDVATIDTANADIDADTDSDIDGDNDTDLTHADSGCDCRTAIMRTTQLGALWRLLF